MPTPKMTLIHQLQVRYAPWATTYKDSLSTWRIRVEDGPLMLPMIRPTMAPSVRYCRELYWSPRAYRSHIIGLEDIESKAIDDIPR